MDKKEKNVIKQLQLTQVEESIDCGIVERIQRKEEKGLSKASKG